MKEASKAQVHERGGIVHVANIKGGVGKSTVATNLAACLAGHGPTLVIDLDMQGSASYALGEGLANPGQSSFQLFRRRAEVGARSTDYAGGVTRIPKVWADRMVQGNRVSLKDLAVEIMPGLDLIPASSALLEPPRFRARKRFVENLKACREMYRFVILDTPSVWNEFMKSLYRFSDLNLIPVTLSALSTRSLKDYLREIKRLIRRYPTTRIRIVKNEVFGKKSTRMVGKVKTVAENRAFLNSLCEMVRYSSRQSTLMLPQSIVFDVEIPEASAIQNAQDQGVPIVVAKPNSAARKSFQMVADRVRNVLNSLAVVPERVAFYQNQVFTRRVALAMRVAAAIVVLFSAARIAPTKAPPIRALSQLEESRVDPLSHTFGKGENIYKFTKYAIYKYRAVVPSRGQVENYMREVVDIYNYTRLPGERRLRPGERNLAGLTLTFYPPSRIRNEHYDRDIVAYEFFNDLVVDDYSYVTGVWCEYGEGGGQPHKGIDIAAPIGTPLKTPIDGVVYNRRTRKGGKIVGIVRDDHVLFFAHLSKSRFPDGTPVRRGEVVALVGMTGRSSGPHVHVGYGVRFPLNTSVRFGNQFYEVTDPRHFFYRCMYDAQKPNVAPSAGKES